MSALSPAQILKKSAECVERRETDKAQKLLSAGLKAHPSNYDIAVAYARISEQLGQWKNAAERWNRIRQKFPDKALGYAAGAGALLAADKVSEAERLVKEGLIKFEGDIWVLNAAARLAIVKGDFDQALKLYQTMQELYPTDARGFGGAAEVLIGAKRYKEAETDLPKYIMRFPDDVWLAHFFATLPMHHSDWAEAIKRWDALLSKFPEHKIAQQLKAQALTHLEARLF